MNKQLVESNITNDKSSINNESYEKKVLFTD